MAVADLSRINTNIAALNSLNALRDVNTKLSTHQARLATGRRINSAMDDAAGLTLATKMNNRAVYTGQAIDNIGDAKNLLSVAEGGLKKINEIITKMRVKAQQGISDTLGASERTAINNALTQYAAEIDDIVAQTTWNGNKLIDGLTQFTSSKIVLQTGAEADDKTELTGTDFQDASVSSILSSYSASASSTTDHIATTLASTTGVFTDTAVQDGSAFSVSTIAVTGSELNSGTYTVRFDVTNASAAAGGSVQLWKEGTLVSQSATVLDTATADATNYDFSNGLRVTVDIATVGWGAAGGTSAFVSFDVSYTKEGSWTGTVNDSGSATDVVKALDDATDAISARLQTVGALMDRLTIKEEALAISKVNTEAAFNRIMNADMAMEQLEATKYSILQQTAVAMLAQANTAPQSVLQLFR